MDLTTVLAFIGSYIIQEGHAVETEKCGSIDANSWECFYGNPLAVSNLASEIPEVQAEVGPYCRCGCIVHLGQAKPKRLLATSSQSCPGRTFWLIQADEDHIIQFKVEQFSLPCGTQWLKVRDGSSLSSALLEHINGNSKNPIQTINSTGPSLLVEFVTNEVSVNNHLCGGGFFAYAIQQRPTRNITGAPIAQGVGVIPVSVIKLTAVHVAAIFFLCGLLIATTFLGTQYLCRYRKYHVAKDEDQDSLADANASYTSIPLRNRAISNSTLLSEVISLTKLRPHFTTPRHKHNRLRESIDCDGEEHQEVTLAKEEESLSVSSATITPEETLTTAVPQTVSEYDVAASCHSSPRNDNTLRRSSTTTTASESDKDKTMEKHQHLRNSSQRRLSNVSTVMLTKVSDSSPQHSKSDPGSYSPAASFVSTATIRTTNPKETKDKWNREKVLAGPVGSEFSLAGPETDLEIDYYDYNVVNAGAAPGSFLGMDPAFLVWIPPLDETGEILPEEMDIRPKKYIDPGSNQESPEEEALLRKTRSPSISESSKSTPLLNKLPRKIYPLVDIKSISNDSIYYERASFPRHESAKVVSIQLHEFPKLQRDCLAKVHKEKETSVEKYSKDGYNFEDIKFADDDDEAAANLCNKSYQDSNIISSS